MIIILSWIPSDQRNVPGNKTRMFSFPFLFTFHRLHQDRNISVEVVFDDRIGSKVLLCKKEN